MHEEQHRIFLSKAPGEDPPPSIPIHRLFEAQADRSPDRVAVYAGKRSVNYAELDRHANRLAHALRRRGVRPSHNVAVLLPHGIETPLVLLAILKTGAAYVPLDPGDPPRRLRFVVDAANIRLIVTSSALAPVAASTGATAMVMDSDEDVSDRASDQRLDVRVTGVDCAYVLYTSGSTGRPKGVAVPHRALVNYIVWANSMYQPGSGRDFPLHSSLAFDLTVTSIFCPLTAGGAIVAYPGRPGEPAILDVLRDDLVDVIKLTPSHLAIVAAQNATPARLRVFVVGGENLDTALARRIHQQFDGRVAIFNEYGPTETTVGCMIHRFDVEADRRRSVPIGVAAANTRIYLLDEQWQPVESGGVGEIYVGGAGVASGYIGQSELTAQRFLPDPWLPGERVYRSGDRARRLADGGLEFCGRADDEVKVRGHRIDLAEIRHVLLEHPLITNCAVRRLEEGDGRSVLVAYCVAAATITAESLRTFAAEQMTQAAIPGAFVFVDQLPMTRNGKVDERSLPGLDVIRSGWRGHGRPPATITERTVAGIWQRLLHCDRVGTLDSFFQLGGDSLAAVQLFEEVERTFGVRLPSDVLFPDATLEALAAAIENRRSPPKRSPLVPIRAIGKRPPLFLVHSIGGEVLSYQPLVQHLDPGLPVYGLQRRVSEHRRQDPLSIESMAAEYVEAIRAAQLRGPYFLGGYSAGGVIAFEIARQIHAAGQRVGLLAIIDGTAPVAVPRRPTSAIASAIYTVRNFGFWCVDDLLTTNASDIIARIQSRVRLWSRGVRRIRGSGGGHDPQHDVRDVLGVPGMGSQNIPWLESYAEAIGAYRPGPYPGRVVLYRARTFGLFEEKRPDRGWSGIVGGIDVRVLRGDHATILREPRVRQLAEQMNKALESQSTATPPRS